MHRPGTFETLLITQLDSAKVKHRILHGGQHLLPTARMSALVKRGNDPQRQMQPGSTISDLRTTDHGRTIIESGG